MSKPKIRFKGYEEDWEQRKVKEFAIESEVKGHSGKDAKKLTVKLHNKGVYVADEKIQGSDNTQYYIRRAGQFIYGKQNFFNGAIGIVPKKLDKYESTKDVPAFDVSSDVNVDWLYYYIARPEIYKPQEALCTGTGSKRFHVNNFYNLSLAIPKMDEQIKIKEYFVHLDNLITLHQRKCEETKKLKKYMLQKMFPQNGKRVPEIRFAGFTDDWEQRKLGDVTELKSASRVHKGEWTDSGVPFFRSSDVMAAINGTTNEKAYISEELYEKLSNASGKLEEGDVLVTGGGSVGNPYIVPNNEPLYTKDADLLWIKNQGRFYPYFLYEYFFSPTFRIYLSSISHVGTIAHYTITQLSETPISLPDIEEQIKVGEYFESLDRLITLHQHKCEKYVNIKKGMISELLVGNIQIR